MLKQQNINEAKPENKELICSVVYSSFLYAALEGEMALRAKSKSYRENKGD